MTADRIFLLRRTGDSALAEQWRIRLPQQPPDLTEHDDCDSAQGTDGLRAVKAAMLLPAIARGRRRLKAVKV
ncbi:MAG TPA: hypothetical protein VJS47_02870 [Rhizomicrobium sp.]|nr:hypothetical protein [Rhizomicrobium sp.]